MIKKSIVIFLSDIVAIVHFIIKKLFVLFKPKLDKKGLRILVYHSVLADSFYKDLEEYNTSLDAFKQQMQILKRTSKKIVSLTEGIKGLSRPDLSCDSVAITFDDGMANLYNGPLRVLENFNIPATFFVVYKYIDSNKQFLESGPSPKDGYMNWRMVLSLMQKGYEIGTHSYSHKRLSRLKDEGLDREIVYAKDKFEEKGLSVEYFAYPYGFYGDFSEKAEAFIKKAGYRAAMTNIMGENIPGDNLFRLKRTRISWRDNPFRFRMKLNGAYDWVDALKYIFLKGG